MNAEYVVVVEQSESGFEHSFRTYQAASLSVRRGTKLCNSFGKRLRSTLRVSARLARTFHHRRQRPSVLLSTSPHRLVRIINARPATTQSIMSTKKANSKTAVDGMRQEYDLSGGERGRCFAEYQKGTNIVLLDPDVAKAFRNSEAVNRALRQLLADRSAKAPKRRAG
jgi:hypothetical protein